MSELIGLFNLLAPFFGLIGLGFFCGKVVRQHEAGLAWMQFFLIYVALPCLFFRLIADKPLDQLANWPFIAATTLSTFLVFALAFGTGWRHTRDLPQSVMQGVAGSYSNVGYMGPPLVLGALGAAASAPVVLIFVFDNLLLFSLVPLLMSVAGVEKLSVGRDDPHDRLADPDPSVQRGDRPRHRRQLSSSATASGRRPDGHLALGCGGPCALFILGVTVAMRPLWRIPDGRADARDDQARSSIRLLIWMLLSAIGDFGAVWTYAAITMAALPPALNIFVIATQYDVGVERASACVLIGTLASMVTLTGLLLLIRLGALPYDLFP